MSLSNSTSIFSPDFERRKIRGVQSASLRSPTPANPAQSPAEEAIKQPSTKFVFHEQEVSGVMFRAMVETGRVVLHMQNSNGRESSVDLIGEAFALPCLCYAEDGWQRRGMISGPPGWAICHDSAREPRMFLGHLHRDDVRLLTHEFGLHRRGGVDHQVEFKDTIAGQSLKQIMLHDPTRAALFRKTNASLDHWAEQVVSEEPARPGMSDVMFWL